MAHHIVCLYAGVYHVYTQKNGQTEFTSVGGPANKYSVDA